jgi:dUTP pyrophosphatase
MSSLSGEEVAKFLKSPPDIKINPNGVDVKVSEVWMVPSDAIATIDGKTRTTSPEKIKISPVGDFYELPRGVYDVRIANEIEVPAGIVGFCHPRSTLNRLGIVKSETGIWDSGYKGFGTQTIFVPIKLLRINKDEFWFQIRMQRSEKSKHSYDGHWQGEKPV